MLVDDPDKKLPFEGRLVDVDSGENAAGPSTSPLEPLLPSSQRPQLPEQPPLYESSASGRVEIADSNYFVPPGGEDSLPPPPDFAPYVAEYFEDGSGCVISHDPHLNEDGEALYRFLLSHSRTPPQLYLHVKGEHEEHQTRSVSHTDARGHTRWETHTETVTVPDFDFCVDASTYVLPQPPTQWTVPDEEPAYRGGMVREVDEPGAGAWGDLDLEGGRRSRRGASREERKRVGAWVKERKARGLPPWVGAPNPQRGLLRTGADVYEHEVLKSTRTVRAWADEYCASTKMLKEFTYKKMIYGWNFSALEAAITAAVRSTHYTGTLSVQFTRRADEVHVRADTWLSRVLSHKWLVVLLWITFLYPFVWLFKRFAASGGGRWEVCGGAYALKARKLVDGAVMPQPPAFPQTFPQPRPDAPEVVGVREGEWFQAWEGTIKRAVMGRLKSHVALTVPDDSAPLPAAVMLDGYMS
ncbi:hypothetical protein BDW22DRAFT_1386075 [Trametopsis cervina]|nr:hypothetical protein BDW22DRAFT_1386075 [Trametopsis cervina]